MGDGAPEPSYLCSYSTTRSLCSPLDVCKKSTAHSQSPYEMYNLSFRTVHSCAAVGAVVVPVPPNSSVPAHGAIFALIHEGEFCWHPPPVHHRGKLFGFLILTNSEIAIALCQIADAAMLFVYTKFICHLLLLSVALEAASNAFCVSDQNLFLSARTLSRTPG